MRIAFITNQITGTCGVSIYSRHLLSSLKAIRPDLDITLVNIVDASSDVQPSECINISRDCSADYASAGARLSQMGCAVACVQHEYGLFGGNAGGFLLRLLQTLNIPAVCVMHTILKYPDPNEALVLESIARRAQRVVSLSTTGVEFLSDIYGVPRGKIAFIPHGVPVYSETPRRRELPIGSVDGRFVLLTFGLLSRNKNIESVMRGLSRLVAHFPNLLYIVAGQTHPKVKLAEGESYRDALVSLATTLGIERNVLILDSFLDEVTLEVLLRRADVYIAPVAGPEQIVSGTLSYALGAAKPIIATKTWYANELLHPDAGILVDHNDDRGIADAIMLLLTQPAKRSIMVDAARRKASAMSWDRVAQQYLDLLADTCKLPLARMVAFGETQRTDSRIDDQSWPALNLDHFKNLIDDTGIIQHARFLTPDYSHGYCTDDVARALIVIARLWRSRELGTSEADSLVRTFLKFLNYGWNRSEKRMRNFLTFDRQWTESAGSECSHGRTVWALGTLASQSEDLQLINAARMLYREVLDGVQSLSELRAIAFCMLGAGAFLDRFPGDSRSHEVLERGASHLLSAFTRSCHKDWTWFEDNLTYFNARIPHALLVAGRHGVGTDTINAALSTLDWLIEKQIPSHGLFSPVGNNGFWRQGSEMPVFDQQPIEACAMIGACREAHILTQSRAWIDVANTALGWFHGANIMMLSLYNQETGGCFDGLSSSGLNLNQGAEAILSYLQARLECAELLRVESSLPPAAVDRHNHDVREQRVFGRRDK